MGYRKIINLYKNKEILMFKKAYALEKIHGTSGHLGYKVKEDKLFFYSGGASSDRFVELFDKKYLLETFQKYTLQYPNLTRICIYGEVYGGKMQNMSDTYGKNLKFVAFEVSVKAEAENSKLEYWLSVDKAHLTANIFNIEFVDYKIINTTEEEINYERDRDSTQAIRNNMGTGHLREGIVLRPLIELIHPNGSRIISKHKRQEFSERGNSPKFQDPEKFKILRDAEEIAREWVNPMRLSHVLDKFENPSINDTKKVIRAMVDDVYLEAKDEIVETHETKRAIAKATVSLFKKYLNSNVF